MTALARFDLRSQPFEVMFRAGKERRNPADSIGRVTMRCPDGGLECAVVLAGPNHLLEQVGAAISYMAARGQSRLWTPRGGRAGLYELDGAEL